MLWDRGETGGYVQHLTDRVYDLTPLVQTYVNDLLGLDEEAVVAVVVTHAAGAHAAEGNAVLEHMEDAVVEAKLFVPAGSGLLDLPGFFSALDSIGFSAWLMSEQDSAHEPSEAASGVSMENIQKAIK